MDGVDPAISREQVLAHLALCEKDPRWGEWENRVKSAKSSQYREGLAEFLIFAGKMATFSQGRREGRSPFMPTELIALRAKEIKDLSKSSKIEAWVMAYLDYCRSACNRCGKKVTDEEGACPCGGKILAPISRNVKYSAVRGFFSNVLGRAAALNTPNLQDAQKVMTQSYEVDTEIFGKLVEVADTDERWSLYFLAHTGISIGDVDELVYTAEMKAALDRNDDVIIFQYMRTKFQEGGYRLTGICFEAITAFRAYVQKKGLQIGQPLILGHDGKPLDEEAIRYHVRNCVKKAGIETGGKRLSPHNLRKFFRTQATNAGMNQLMVDFITAHKIPEQNRTYFQARQDEIKEWYRKLAERLNPNMAKYQRTLSLEEKVNVLEGKITTLEDIIKRYIGAFQNGSKAEG